MLTRDMLIRDKKIRFYLIPNGFCSFAHGKNVTYQLRDNSKQDLKPVIDTEAYFTIHESAHKDN